MCQCGDNLKVSLLVWSTRYTDTFCNAVNCRFELALEVQRWTRARSECLPGGGKNYSYTTGKCQYDHWLINKAYLFITVTNISHCDPKTLLLRLGGKLRKLLRHACGRYSQHYSPGGSSDAASCYQSTLYIISITALHCLDITSSPAGCK